MSILLPVLTNAAIIPVVFILPVECGEKMGYCLTTLLAFVVILTLVTGEMSRSSKTTSLLEVYIVIVLFTSVISVILTACSVMLHSMEGTPHRYLQKLCKLMEMTLCEPKNTSKVQDLKDSDSKPPSYKTEPSSVVITTLRDTDDKASPPASRGGDDVTDDVTDDVMTHQRVSAALDACSFRVVTSLTALLTFVFMMVLTLGQGSGH